MKLILPRATGKRKQGEDGVQESFTGRDEKENADVISIQTLGAAKRKEEEGSRSNGEEEKEEDDEDKEDEEGEKWEGEENEEEEETITALGFNSKLCVLLLLNSHSLLVCIK